MNDRVDDSRPLPHVALSSFAHDRHGLERTDADWLGRAWADPTTRVLAIAGNRMLVRDGVPAWLPVAELPSVAQEDGALRLLVGEHEGATYFAAVVDPARAPHPAEQWQGTREVLEAVLGSERGQILLHAMSMAA